MLIIVSVKFVLVPPSVVTVQEGQNIKLDCLATGFPSPTITWSRRHKKLEVNKVNVNGSLIVKSISKDDGDKYTCTAKNSLGKKTYSFTIKLQPLNGSKIIRLCVQSVNIHYVKLLYIYTYKLKPNF